MDGLLYLMFYSPFHISSAVLIGYCKSDPHCKVILVRIYTFAFLLYIHMYSSSPEEVVQVYGICIRTLHLPVISVMIIGVMRLSYNERAVSEGRFRHHLFQAVFVRTSYPSRYMYCRWSRVHKAVETAVTATVVM